MKLVGRSRNAPASMLLIIAALNAPIPQDLISKSSASPISEQQQQTVHRQQTQDADPQQPDVARTTHISSGSNGKMKSLDDFLASLPTLNVSQRHSARFECELSHGQQLDKLVWVKLRRSTNSSSQDDVQLLSLNQRLITPDRRFSVHKQSALRWTLSLDNVGPDDSHAFFLCQAGAAETSGRYASGARLNVLAPPRFVDGETSPSEIEAVELEPLTLRCQVESEPRAQLTWKREDGRPLDGVEQLFQHRDLRRYPIDRKLFQTLSVDSSELQLSPFRRRHSGAYLCIASNGVQPGLSRRFGVSATVCFESEAAKAEARTEPCEPAEVTPEVPAATATTSATTTTTTSSSTASPRRRQGSAAGRARSQPAPDKRRARLPNEVSIKQHQSSRSHLIAPELLPILATMLLIISARHYLEQER